MLGLDYYDHTQDKAEFKLSILPLCIAVTDFVSSYYDRSSSGKLDVWPTQSLEGCRPGVLEPGGVPARCRWGEVLACF